MADQPIRVVVEVASPEAMKALQAENAALRSKVDLLESRLTALHETLYRLLDRFGDLQRSLKTK